MKKKASLILLASLLSTTFTAQAAHWGYGDNSEEQWAEHYPTCGAGQNQSPINIMSALHADLASLDINYKGRVSDIVNNGHTIEAHVNGENTITIDGETFSLKQFHFHTPSENYIDGKQYPLEAHFVNVSEKGHIAVVAVMFKHGLRTSDGLTTLLKQIPAKDQTVALSDVLNPEDLLPREREYFRFNGSLTTPPCTEGVRWFVLQEPTSSTAQQTEKLHHVMGDNNRPLQPLNARLIIE